MVIDRMKVFLLTLMITAGARAAVADAYLVKDINLTPSPVSANPQQIVSAGPYVYFAVRGVFPYEIWRTDGTDAGTIKLKTGEFAWSVNHSNTFYFTIASELWKSDGSVAGTVMVRSFQNVIEGLYSAGDGLYIPEGGRLWKSDGSANAPVLLAETSSGYGYPQFRDFTAVGSKVFFVGSSSATGSELWATSGTPQTTAVVRDITAGPNSTIFRWLRAVGGVLLFAASDGVSGTELWRSDGTAAGTSLVKDIYAGPPSGAGDAAVVFNGLLYFTAYDVTSGAELWRSDGTTAGTYLVGDYAAGSSSSYPSLIHVANARLLLVASDSQGNSWLWSGDGTPGGNLAIQNLGWRPTYAVSNGSALFYIADSFSSSAPTRGLWKSDGTAAGTMLVKPFESTGLRNAYSLTSGPAQEIYFSGEDSAHGLELWKTNGNPAGTTLIKDVVVVSANSEPTAFTDLNGVMYFLANDGIHGKEIWRSDGTESGTFMVKEVFDGPDPGPYTLTSCGELLYTTGPDSDYGWELWRSDGTATGTFMLRDINTGTSGGFPLGSNPSRLTCVGNQLFFFAQVPADTPYASSVMSLWKTDGSSIGTILVKKFTTSSSADVVMAGLRSSAIFYLEGKLQISDGYTVTVLKDIGPGYRIVTTPNLAFFDGNNMLWRTDGTTAGTFTLPTAGYPVHMHPVGDKVFFFDSTGNSSTSAVRLTDGTAAGTIALQTNLWVGSRSGNESRVVGDSNSAFFFAAQTPSQFDTALWRSDGTPGAAAEVSSVRSPQLITDGDGVVFFAADWNRYFFRLDSAGATAIQGPAGALRVSEIGKSGTRVFAAAGELYAVDLAFATATISPATVTSSGGTTITIDGTGFDANTIVLVDGMQMPVNFVSASRLTFVAPAHVPGTARVEVRHLSGQVAKLTRGLMYVCDAIPTAVASGSAAFCPGGSTQLQGSGGVSCRWLPAAGLSDANSCSPTASPAVTTTYVLTVTSANGCASTNQASVTVQVHAVPDATITSPFSVDPNTNTTSSVADAGPGATYVWTIEQGEIVSGASSRTVTWRTSCATAGPVKLAVTVQTANGCTSSKEQLVSKRIIPSIAAISPTFGYTGTAVTLTGTRFTCVNSVTVGPHSVPFVATGDTTIQFTIPSLASAGQTLVAVRSPLGSDVRSFFSTAPPAKGDFTRDGWPDLLLRNPITGGNALWTMDGGTVTGVIDLVSFPNRNYRFAGTGDFTEDGLNDILLRNTLTGANAIWVMIGAAFNSVIDLPAIQNTQITFAATGDFNGDRKSDIVLRNYQTGANAVWLIERGKYVRTIDLPAIANSAIRFEGTGDFNGDDKTDIVLRNQTTGANAVWLMNGTALLAVVDLPALPNVDFRLAAVADLSKDGKPDLVWRNYATGQNAIWFMNGTSLAGVMDLPPLTNLDYEISGPR